MKLSNKIQKIIFSLLLMILVIQLLSPVSFSIGAFEFETSVKFGTGGKTFIHFPPLGNIIASTHTPPIDFHLSLKNIHLEALSQYTKSISQESLMPENMLSEILVTIVKYLVSLLIFVFFLGMVASLLWSRGKIRIKEMLFTGLINIMVLLMFFSTSALTYDQEAFSQAEYQGILEAAPWVLSFLEEGAGIIEEIGIQFANVVDNISILQKEMEKNVISGEDISTLNVLHISDIHNNPTAFDFIGRIKDTFHVDLIIDTGDLVDYGTTFELDLLTQFIRQIHIPYVFIPGNHESPIVIEQLKTIENIIVLEEGIIEIEGLSIAGIADPASSSTAMVVADENLMEEAAQRLYETVAHAEKVDIIAAHNPLSFKYLRNNNNLLLGGHQHSPYIKKTDNYVEINAGSTGASGIRGVQKLEINYSLVLLKFQLSEEGALIPFSADLIKVKHFPLNFSFERFLFSD
ncbi:MAG: metallophosphoesterase [Bacillota bacterium]|nr:metallophosphoesterase [Bacillota bacterium]